MTECFSSKGGCGTYIVSCIPAKEELCLPFIKRLKGFNHLYITKLQAYKRRPAYSVTVKILTRKKIYVFITKVLEYKTEELICMLCYVYVP